MLSVIELLAVISAGTYGVLLARRKQMDFVGIFFVSLITAFGGGTLRDLFLDRHPLFWIENHHYPTIVFSLAFVFSLLKETPNWLEKLLPLPDALGLGLFSMAGVSVAIDAGCSLFIASLMGVITGTFGGVIGDIVCNDIPSLFKPDTPLYATCSFVGCWCYLILHLMKVSESTNLVFCICLIVILRLVALRFGWCLPHRVS